MKKIFISLILFSCIQANAFEFINKLSKESSKAENVSSLIWYGDYNEMAQLSGFPGKNDSMHLAGPNVINIDRDFSIGSFVVNAKVVAENRKLNVKGIYIHLAPGEGGLNSLTLKNSTLKATQHYSPAVIGGLEERYVSRALLKLINSTAKFGGLYSMTVSNTNLKPSTPIGGSMISLEGKSQLEFGGILMDSFIKSNPELITSDLEFIERDGNIPQLIFNSDSNDIARTNIKLLITQTAKKGKYTIIEFTGKSSYEGVFDTIIINGKKIAFDEFRQVGSLKAKLTKAPSTTGKDKSTANDIVLVIEDSK